MGSGRGMISMYLLIFFAGEDGDCGRNEKNGRKASSGSGVRGLGRRRWRVCDVFLDVDFVRVCERGDEKREMFGSIWIGCDATSMHSMVRWCEGRDQGCWSVWDSLRDALVG